MGVPSFYRWLKDKYPNVVVKATEDEGECINTSLPIPNGIEFDNLYLDLNGIIHPGLCPEDQPSRPETFEDVFNNIFDYVDNLFSIVRPRKLLYMAIDGVAPWAKMNQQRSGRFRTIKARERHDAEIERLMREFVMEGKPVYDLLHKDESEVILDSHMITPGTEFMYKFSKALRSYVISRTKSDPGWRDIKVIISDANVPGEGEHKIMSFIRQQRNVSTGYNPNTRHCVCGLDADLIMLALATHEVHFSILREEPPTIDESSVKKRAWFKKPFEFVHVWILREYLELDMKISDPPPNLEIDLERIVDDFIFMCFFVGNDFLPRMPSLEVHEGAIDLLMTVYKKEFKNFGGYLLDMSRLSDSEDKRNGYINLSRVEKFILLVGSYEDKNFKKRIYLRERQLRYLCNDSNKQDEHEGHALSSEKAPTSIDSADISEQDEHEGHALSSEKAPTSRDSEDISEIEKNTYELIEKYNDNLLKSIDLFKNGQFVDKVRLGTAGWKERYYKEKFSANTWRDIESLRKELVKKYTEGLLWVLLYYFSAVPSWSWFYPYHYSPFASDLKGLAEVSVEFQKGSPLKPFDNLLAVLPLKSAHVLPKVYQALMTDDEFKLIDFYPTDFDIDLDGKRFRRQGIYKLPFVEEKRLLSETKELESGLLEDEALRNRNNVDQLYVSSTHKLASQILSLTPHENEVVEIDTSMSVGISGYIHLPNEDTEIVHRELRNSIEENSVLCVSFEMCDDVHIPGLLDGVILPIKSITEEDILETKLWHGFYSNKPSNRLQYESCRKSYSSTDSASSISPKMIHEGYQSRFTTDSSSEVIYKGAGVGWGAGRGKVNDTSNINKHIESRERVILPRNGETSGANNVRQQRINFRDPSHQGRGQHGATVSPTSSWKHSSATSSVQGRGRSRHSSVEESGSH
ncbi:5'-3' exoribonuclease 3-like isoform X2 [Alnus glutinosa]|uniref:5'-3' exoribonuclease 3-like isoform X2 n=1 Tax=Alnus glutinosa TaxID=3517 RepID=UPI002D79E59B|nr:5'-3' exoribonuclease 3-like isoform X2 [Alnus glutinosa]